MPLQGGPKNVPLCHFSYLRQILTDYRNFFIVTFCGQLAITQLLNIPLYFNRVTTLPCRTYFLKNH